MKIVPSDKPRYRERGNTRRWTDDETIAVLVAVLSCTSEASHRRSCVQLCEYLGRRPRPEPKSREELLDACANLIDNRVWDLIVAYRAAKPPEELVRHIPNRNHKPLNWAEKRLVRKYFKTSKSQPPVEHISLLIGRTDTTLVENWLNWRRRKGEGGLGL